MVHGHGFAGVEILRTLGHGGAMRSWNVDALEDPGVVCGIETRRRRQSVREVTASPELLVAELVSFMLGSSNRSEIF